LGEKYITNSFHKRIYTASRFFHDFSAIIESMPDIIKASRTKRVTKAFREKLFVAVSNVLGCRHCSWLHTEIALSKGVDKKEIHKILSQEIGEFPEDEAVALAFAQHYSETSGRPKKDAEQRFYQYYGQEIAKGILKYIQIIYFGNLAGNTVDAFLERLKGQPVEGSTFWGELIIFLLTAPYFLIILPLLATRAHHLGRYI
jgi:AhpD family alkylhydroperoxidase